MGRVQHALNRSGSVLRTLLLATIIAPIVFQHSLAASYGKPIGLKIDNVGAYLLGTDNRVTLIQRTNRGLRLRVITASSSEAVANVLQAYWHMAISFRGPKVAVTGLSGNYSEDKDAKLSLAASRPGPTLHLLQFDSPDSMAAFKEKNRDAFDDIKTLGEHCDVSRTASKSSKSFCTTVMFQSTSDEHDVVCALSGLLFSLGWANVDRVYADISGTVGTPALAFRRTTQIACYLSLIYSNEFGLMDFKNRQTTKDAVTNAFRLRHREKYKDGGC